MSFADRIYNFFHSEGVFISFLTLAMFVVPLAIEASSVWDFIIGRLLGVIGWCMLISLLGFKPFIPFFSAVFLVASLIFLPVRIHEVVNMWTELYK